MPVSFSKDGPLGEFDGFDATAIYQMVPERDRRDITVRTQRECVLEIGDSNVASMANFIRFSGPAIFNTLTYYRGDHPASFSARSIFDHGKGGRAY